MVLFSVVTNNGKDVCVQLTKEKNIEEGRKEGGIGAKRSKIKPCLKELLMISLLLFFVFLGLQRTLYLSPGH